MKRWFTLGVVGLLVAACSADAGSGRESTGETRTVSHAMGQTEVPVSPERVVTLWASTLSAAIALDVRPAGYAFNAEPVPGVDVPRDYDVDELEYIGHAQELDLERIIAADPDVILTVDVHEEVYDELSSIAPTVVLEWGGTSAWQEHLTDVARVLDLEERADKVVAEYDDRVKEVAEAIGDPAGIEASVVRFHAEELRLEVRNSFAGQVLDDVGLARPESQDVVEEGAGYLPVSLERLREADGDAMFVFTIADTDDEAPNLLERARGNPLWERLSAVRADAVHTVDYLTWIGSNYFAAHGVLDDLEKALG